MQAWTKGYLHADQIDRTNQDKYPIIERDQDYQIRQLEAKLFDRQEQISQLQKHIKIQAAENLKIGHKMSELEDEIGTLKHICARTGDELVEERERVDQLEEKIAEIMGMINDDRETIDIMWNAACMPGGQEAAEMAKVHWEDLANAE
jgi:septal ring factor EnvC (AmiA/AmiB activator)